MANTLLNRTEVVLLSNKSGGDLAQGAVVIVDSANAAAFTTTTTSGSANSLIGVILDPNGIANNATGTVALGGYVPKVNLSGSASLGDLFKTHTVAGQAVRHAPPAVAGDFGEVLGTGTTPAALLFGAPVQGTGGGAGTVTSVGLSLPNTFTVTNSPVTGTGTLTGAWATTPANGSLLIGNGSSYVSNTLTQGANVTITNSSGSITIAATSSGAGADGWTAATGTWTYSSADAPTYVISVNVDMTTVIGVGMRIKLTQTTAKYFIVTAVGAYSGGATLITVYGGTDYTLADAAITSPYYSVVKAPLGFPLSPAKWTQTYTDTSLRTQATPSANTWYNINSALLSVPVGCWGVIYAVTLVASDASSAVWLVKSTLSTANNSESDSTMTAAVAGGPDTDIVVTVSRSQYISIAAKTTYYLNSLTTNSGLDNIYNSNGNGALVISATCAYL